MLEALSVYTVCNLQKLNYILNLEGNVKHDNCTQLEGSLTYISCVTYLGNHSSVVIAASFLQSIRCSWFLYPWKVRLSPVSSCGWSSFNVEFARLEIFLLEVQHRLNSTVLFPQQLVSPRCISTAVWGRAGGANPAELSWLHADWTPSVSSLQFWC